nr:retrovirus-related Pol polyprotein from transposon TNT 1-94 [Tanacetum cinerariifolium]
MKLIDNCKQKSTETKFDKPSIVRQPNAQRIPKPSVLGKPTPFSDSLERKNFSKTKSVPKTNVSEGLSKPITTQILHQTENQAVSNTKVIKPGGNHKTNVSRPQHRSTQMKDKVVPNNSQIVQLIPFIVEFGCTKHMTGNLKLLCNFVEKYLGIVRFGNDQFAPILGYGDLVQGNIMINRVYYVEGLTYNLFLVGQFCDVDLEVAFQKSTCFVRDLQGNDLLTNNRGSDLYIISLQETTSSTPLCLMAKASPTQAWLWHRRLSHLNFDYINLLSKKDVVIGLPNLKYVKDQLCSSCEVSKAKRSSFKTKTVPSSKGWLNLLYMDLCGPMRIAIINGKKYILKASDYDNSDPVPQIQNVLSLVDTTIPSQQELDLLFGPLYDEFINADHPLEQVCGNPSKPVQTRRQLEINPEMCMFAITFDRLQVWELVDKPFDKHVIKLKWLWKNKKDEKQTVIRNKAQLVANGYAQEEGIDSKNHSLQLLAWNRPPSATAGHLRPPPPPTKNFSGELFWRTPKTLLPPGSTRSTTPLATTRRHHLRLHATATTAIIIYTWPPPLLHLPHQHYHLYHHYHRRRHPLHPYLQPATPPHITPPQPPPATTKVRLFVCSSAPG